jgi:hypothetical protein
LRGRRDQQALLAVARHDHFAIAPAFEDGVKAVQPQVFSWSFLSVAVQAGSLQDGGDILLKGHVLLVGDGGKFADIVTGDVPFFGRRIGRRILGRGLKFSQEQT